MAFSRHPETLDEAAHPTARKVEPRYAPQLFIVVECDRLTAGSSRYSLADVDQVTLGRGPSREAERTPRALALRVPGGFMSTTHARVVRRGDAFVLQDASSRNGTFFDGQRVNEMTLTDGDVFECGHTLFLFRAATPIPDGTSPDFDSAQANARPSGLRTVVPTLAEHNAQLEVIAQSAVSTLLLGETGTGKEVTARAIHTLSARKGAFVPVNCGAIPEALVEAQLFGHVKGAFSGATRDELGFVRAADGGTLFLDEIGDLPKASQSALLRVLQQREVTPVGTTRAVPVDLRVVSATHKPLEDDAYAQEFRRDLLARLAGYTFHLPRLRDRIEDLGLLIAELASDAGVHSLSVEVGRALVRHKWPLNVRELAQTLTSAAVLAGAGPILPQHLPASLSRAPRPESAPPAALGELEDDALREALVHALTKHRGNVAAVSRALGKAPMQIHRWMKRFAIDPDAYRD